MILLRTIMYIETEARNDKTRKCFPSNLLANIAKCRRLLVGYRWIPKLHCSPDNEAFFPGKNENR